MSTRSREKPSTDRRTAIADASIELLAETGTRGLTHRMVDRRLGIPEGSTGSYHRTRQALLEATAKRIVELDLAVIEATSSVDPDDLDLAQVITALVLTANDPQQRSRNLARNVMLMEAANNPELSRVMFKSRSAYVGAAEDLLRHRGIERPELVAQVLSSFMAGLILSQVIYAEPTLTRDQIAWSIQRFLDSYQSSPGDT